MEDKVIYNILLDIDDYLLSINRNISTSYFQLTLAFPQSWFIPKTDGDNVEFVVEKDMDEGKIVRITPLTDDVKIDDLINMIKLLVQKNLTIEKQKATFEDEFLKLKNNLENSIDESLADIYKNVKK